MTRAFVVFFALCGLALGQIKLTSVCKLLTPDEASAVIGAAPKLVNAIENGGCGYQQARLRLDVAKPVRMADRNTLAAAFESSSGDGKAKPLAGVGDRAHIKKENSGYQILFLKGDAMGGVSVHGEGSDDAGMAEKLTEAAKKVASRL